MVNHKWINTKQRIREESKKKKINDNFVALAEGNARGENLYIWKGYGYSDNNIDISNPPKVMDIKTRLLHLISD